MTSEVGVVDAGCPLVRWVSSIISEGSEKKTKQNYSSSHFLDSVAQKKVT